MTARISKAHCGHARPLFYPVPWPTLVGRVASPCRCLPANRLPNESFVSNDSRPRPNMEQQSQSGGKPGVLRLRCPWLTAAVSSGLASLDLKYRDARDSCITQSQSRTLLLGFPQLQTQRLLDRQGGEAPPEPHEGHTFFHAAWVP